MIRRTFALALLLLLLLAACAPAAPAAQTPAEARIVSMAPATTEILIGLGLGDAIVAADSYSLPLLGGDVLSIDAFDITKPNLEAILTVSPTLVFASEMNRMEGDTPFSVLTDAGAEVLYLPTANSIDEVADSIREVGAAAGKSAEAEALAADMLAEIEAIRTQTAAVTAPKTVYFEIGADPQLYTFGAGTFLNKLLAVCNVQNVFADQEGWLAVGAESVLERNPDVILTNTEYIDGIVDIILTRPGFADITAVKNGTVYLIGADASSRASQHITVAVRQIAEAVYPELFE